MLVSGALRNRKNEEKFRWCQRDRNIEAIDLAGANAVNWIGSKIIQAVHAKSADGRETIGGSGASSYIVDTADRRLGVVVVGRLLVDQILVVGPGDSFVLGLEPADLGDDVLDQRKRHVATLVAGNVGDIR